MKGLNQNPRFQIAMFAVSIALSKGLSLIMLPIFTRFLSPSEMGELELVAVTMAALGILISFALHEALYRFAHNNPMERAPQLFTLTLSISISFAVLALIAVSLFGHHTIISQGSLYILALSLAIESPLAFSMVWLRMQDQTTKFIKISLSIALLQALMVLLSLNLGYGVQGILLSALIAHLIQLFWARHASALRLKLPRARLTKISLRYCLPLMLSGIVAFGLNGAERWIIAANTSLETLGQYAIAAKFALAMCFLIQPFGMWWMPKRIKIAKEQPLVAVQYTELGITLIGIIAIATLCFGQAFISYALPEAYHSSSALLLGTLLMAMGKEWGEMLNLGALVKGKTLALFTINLLVVVCALGSLFVLPSIGIWHILLTLGIAQVARALLIFSLSQHRHPLPFSVFRLALLMVLPVAGLLLAYYSITPWLILLVMMAQLIASQVPKRAQGVSA